MALKQKLARILDPATYDHLHRSLDEVSVLTTRYEALQRQTAEDSERLRITQRDLDTSHKQANMLLDRITAAEACKYKAPAPDPRALRGMPFKLGKVRGTIYGGPYRECPADISGVKMAVEIKKDCLIDVPTRDFNVPAVNDLRLGLLRAVLALRTHGELYAGCMGGIGRTGLFMSALAKMMWEAGENLGIETPAPITPLAVQYVRKHYRLSGGHEAVETEQQMAYINELNVADLVADLRGAGII